MTSDKAFPEKVYVKRENEGEKEEFLNICETVEETAEIGEAVSVAIYELKEVVTVTADVEATSIDGGTQG